MMRITSITRKSGTRYTVEVDDAYWYIVDEEILSSCHLRRGMEVDEEFLQQVKRRAEERRAREYAFHLLEVRDYAEKELYDKLCRHVSKETAAMTVAKMIELGLLDDERYAAKLAEFLLTQKKFSRRRALYEMQRRGVSREQAELALEAVEVTPEEQLRALIEQKYLRRLQEPDGHRKVLAALARQGFAYSDIQHALQEYENEEDDSWQYE